MIFVALVLAAATTAPADGVPKARQAYASCLSSYTNDATARKMARDAFLAGLKSKCTDKEAAFRAALIAADKTDGMNDQDSRQDADDQVAEYIEKMTSDFDSGQ
ncbi:MAG: hypothetical protein B7Z20_01245 [Sphingobium sp. 32-64-5]|nr:MAG: hypothetical protein B7Z20_01245 [Sphingobium sp. 32-64-5]